MRPLTGIVVNFIQQPLPPGSTTGSAGTFGQPGALDKGQQASFGLVTFNSFWAYLMPLVGKLAYNQTLAGDRDFGY